MFYLGWRGFRLMEQEASRGPVRTFDFDVPVSTTDAYAAIATALSDEGLALAHGDNARSRVFSIRMSVDGRPVDRYHVPAWRIIPVEASEALAPGEWQEMYGK